MNIREIRKEKIIIEFLNPDGNWQITHYTSWEEVDQNYKEELLDELFNKKGIRIYINSNNKVSIFRELK